MHRVLTVDLMLLAIWVLGACAPAGSFDADAARCHTPSGAASPSTAQDFRLPQALDQNLEERVKPAPQDTSAYVLCMRSRGWKLDSEGRAPTKGLSAQEYNKVVSDDLMVCVREAGDETLSKPSAEFAGSSAARTVCTCLKEKALPGITPVNLNLVIGEGGEIHRVGAQPESPVARCLMEGLPGTAVAQPPSAPWKVAIRILHYQ